MSPIVLTAELAMLNKGIVVIVQLGPCQGVAIVDALNRYMNLTNSRAFSRWSYKLGLAVRHT